VAGAADIDEFAEVKTPLLSSSRRRLLHEALAIVERAGHFKRGDVFAERRELFSWLR